MTKRDELIEAMARALDPYAFEALPSGLGAPAVEHCIKAAGKCLTALEDTLSIDFIAIAEGRSVMVPVQPDDACIYAMRIAMREAKPSGVSGQTSEAVFRVEYARELAAYRAVIATLKGQRNE